MRRTLPSTGALACFEAAFRLNSVSAAADELNLTQSAVSRRILSLEELLGKPLFQREHRRLIPEPAAIRYAREVERILGELETATSRFIAERDDVGLLTVAMPPTFGSRCLIPKLNDFIAQHQGIDINFVSKIRPFDFEQEKIDVAIYLGHAKWPGAHLNFLTDDYVLPVCSPEFLANNSITDAKDVMKCQLLHHTTQPNLWKNWCLAHEIEATDFKTGPRFEFFSHVIGAAMAGVGIALISDLLIQKELRNGELVVPLGTRMKCEEAYYFAFPPRSAEDVNVQKFGAWLKHVFAQPAARRTSRPAAPAQLPSGTRDSQPVSD